MKPEIPDQLNQLRKDKAAERKHVGRVGEDTACRFLVKHGYRIVERNYRKKWGEIDIIAKKGGVICFVEVKTVSRENLKEPVSDENGYKPEDNIHPWKLKRLSRTIQSYLIEHSREGSQPDWQFDAVTVFLDLKHKEAKVNQIPNIVL